MILKVKRRVRAHVQVWEPWQGPSLGRAGPARRQRGLPAWEAAEISTHSASGFRAQRLQRGLGDVCIPGWARPPRFPFGAAAQPAEREAAGRPQDATLAAPRPLRPPPARFRPGGRCPLPPTHRGAGIPEAGRLNSAACDAGHRPMAEVYHS